MHDTLKTRYEHDGYVAPLRIITPEQATHHRRELEKAEAEVGTLHYRFKIHTVMQSPYELATHPALLDAVEQLLGPDILLYGVTYIIKEPHSESHVSWHQDLTYWGLSSDAQVSAWLALSPATKESGCMLMLPGSHHDGMHQHHPVPDGHNVLLSSQTVTDVDASKAKPVVLAPGEASLHHGWTLHTSMPNRSNDRRIGLNIQYIRPDVKQLKVMNDSALLVRGIDHYHHFQQDKPAQQRFDRAAWDEQKRLQEHMVAIQGSTTTTSAETEMKTVSFTEMKHGTHADYALLSELEKPYCAGTARRLLRELASQAEESLSGYQISRLEHGLQSATRAWREGADVDWIVAALLHDIGDGLAPQNHDRMAAEILRPFVREEVSWVIAHHGIFQMIYYAHHFEGWNPNERDQYANNPYYQSAVDFCERWDQNCFDPDYAYQPLDFFAPMVEEVFARKAYDTSVLQSGVVKGLPPLA